jgi:hypothetical protein
MILIYKLNSFCTKQALLSIAKFCKILKHNILS